MRLPNIKSSNFKKGFTLVELLVVIGVLGVLAAGLLASIDPLEQFRKAADNNKRSTALELVNAVNRYYASKQAMPWDSTALGGVDACDTVVTPGTAVVVSNPGTDGAFLPCLTELNTQGELKSTFATQYSILGSLYLNETVVGSTRSISVCFDPQSKSMSRGATTIYTTGAVASASCDTQAERDAAGVGVCHYCAQ